MAHRYLDLGEDKTAAGYAERPMIYRATQCPPPRISEFSHFPVVKPSYLTKRSSLSDANGIFKFAAYRI